MAENSINKGVYCIFSKWTSITYCEDFQPVCELWGRVAPGWDSPSLHGLPIVDGGGRSNTAKYGARCRKVKAAKNNSLKLNVHAGSQMLS